MFSCSCDTMVAMGDVTDNGSIIFGKNSDRQSNEPLSIRYVPSQIYLPNSKVRTTYIEIDQVEKTSSCILFSPTNIFGAEMGFNCHGLVIGNEALFTKISSYEEGLTGMDLVRLVLERCRTSKEGKDTIISLLNKYSQGGNCGFRKHFYYQNSFLLVDRNEGWIIETIGKDYAAKRITQGIHTISNKISFGNRKTFDEYSENLIQQAIANGWCKSIEDFHFEKCYSGFSLNPKEFYHGFLTTHFACSQMRQSRSADLIYKLSKTNSEACSQFSVIDMFNVLRDHQQSKSCPGNGLTNIDICMHGGFGPIRFNQTTGSLVSVIPTTNDQLPMHYATCTSLPCLSVFKPIWLEESALVPAFLLSANNEISNASLHYSSNNIWWKSEIINRNIMKYYQKLIKQIENERDLLENEFVSTSKKLSARNISYKQRNHFTISSFDQVDQLTSEWFSRAHSLSFDMESELSFCHEFTWDRWRISAKIPKEFLVYSKVQSSTQIFVFICLFILFYGFYLQNIIEFGIFVSLFISFIVYLLIVRIFIKKRKTTEEIKLPRLNFND